MFAGLDALGVCCGPEVPSRGRSETCPEDARSRLGCSRGLRLASSSPKKCVRGANILVKVRALCTRFPPKFRTIPAPEVGRRSRCRCMRSVSTNDHDTIGAAAAAAMAAVTAASPAAVRAAQERHRDGFAGCHSGPCVCVVEAR